MEENKIVVDKITKENNRITIDFSVSNQLKQYFNELSFFVEYEENVEKIEDNIAVTPFVSNILPILWLTNSKVYLESIDESFYNSISEIKKGFQTMYPMYDFPEDVIVAKSKVKNVFEGDKNLCLFSGGVDAFSTLISHKDENLELFTILGSDIPLSDEEGIATLKESVRAVEKTFDKPANFCKSNFKRFLNKSVNDLVKDSGDGYWHGFQHGIGIISHAFPFAFLHKIKTVYIASSFSTEEKKSLERLTCASDITIDPYFKIADVNVVHDGVEFDRISKIKNICTWVKENNKNINVHVCWVTTSGHNCSNCEKCFRTILSICVIGELDPQMLGFKIDKTTFKNFKKYFKYSNKMMGIHTLSHYYPIQSLLNENSLYYDELKWFKYYNLDNYYNTFSRRIYKFTRFIYRKFFKRKK